MAPSNAINVRKFVESSSVDSGGCDRHDQPVINTLLAQVNGFDVGKYV